MDKLQFCIITHLASGVLKKLREVVRLRSDSVDGVCLNSPVFGVHISFIFAGFT